MHPGPGGRGSGAEAEHEEAGQDQDRPADLPMRRAATAASGVEIPQLKAASNP
jgi:hypothetical protein